jgi:2-keto-3-deoxy-L-rhamnonate aldolase RhmA
MSIKQRIASRELVVGTWVKTPHPIIVEVLGLTDLDCVVLDAEHAPFDRGSLDSCLIAARGAAKPALVRPATSAPEQILAALDMGAAGVIVPHVRSAAEAEAIVRATRYLPGGRGFAGTTRAAGYTTKGMSRTRADARDIAVIAQIEDVEAVDTIDAIAAVEGIDALFIGRADLTIAYEAETPDDPRVVAAVERICAAGQAAGRAVGMFLPRPGDASQWRAKGASLFLLASEHDFILKGAAELNQQVRG